MNAKYRAVIFAAAAAAIAGGAFKLGANQGAADAFDQGYVAGQSVYATALCEQASTRMLSGPNEKNDPRIVKDGKKLSDEGISALAKDTCSRPRDRETVIQALIVGAGS